jgi:ABC-type amino acid transport substrate-binding protein
MRVWPWIYAAVALLLHVGARADTLDDIKKRGEMVIGLEAASTVR